MRSRNVFFPLACKVHRPSKTSFFAPLTCLKGGEKPLFKDFEKCHQATSPPWACFLWFRWLS